MRGKEEIVSLELFVTLLAGSAAFVAAVAQAAKTYFEICDRRAKRLEDQERKTQSKAEGSPGQAD